MKDNKQEILMKNNKMIKAKYDLNLIENRAFQLILVRMQQKNEDTLIAEILRKDFEKVLKKDLYKTKKGLTEVLDKLYDAKIYFIDEEGDGKARFINNFKFIENDTKVRIKADAEIYKMLFHYLKGYTPINLPIFFSFKSYYTQRLYEFLRLWTNTKKVINYSIEELRDLLMLKNKYTLYKDFKRRVISIAIQELNEKSLMQIEIKEIKTGRKVTSINFIVKDNDKRKYFQDKENETFNKEQQKKTYKKNYDEPKKLKFNNFDQREYDYDALEKKLLGWDED